MLDVALQCFYIQAIDLTKTIFKRKYILVSEFFDRLAINKTV